MKTDRTDSTPDGQPRKVVKSDAEWRAQLEPMQFEVTRHAATERAFTGKYWDHWQPGVYHCVGCGAPLFDASTKFDAGCGWPSYFEPIRGEIVERVTDRSHGMEVEAQQKLLALQRDLAKVEAQLAFKPVEQGGAQ